MKKIIAAITAAVLLASSALAAVECVDQTIEGLPNTCPTISSSLERWSSTITSYIYDQIIFIFVLHIKIKSFPTRPISSNT